MITRRFFVALAVVIGIASCGDHVVIPSDKMGKCTAGILTKCGDTCVDLQTNLANCGACGSACAGARVCAAGKCTDACPPGSTKCGDACVNTELDRANCGMCGKACATNEVCAKGKCAASCEAVGFLTCSGMSGPVDAGGAMNCIDPQRDENNCGACGVKCAPSTERCSRGMCCATGLLGCGGKCVDPDNDESNCGGCGVACGASATCVFGVCSKCNNKLLILSDSNTTTNGQMKTALQKAGFVTTMVDNGISTYAGMPPASDFGAIGVIPGQNFSGSDMPAQGQMEIVAAQGKGAGVVLDGFVTYKISQYTHLQTLKALSLYNYGNTNTSGAYALQYVSNVAPFFTGVPSTFGTANAMIWFAGSPIAGTQFATQTTNGFDCGRVRAMPNGRIVHNCIGSHYSGGAQQWANDVNLSNWTINLYRYAAGCTN